jgi:hypothetical protein
MEAATVKNNRKRTSLPDQLPTIPAVFTEDDFAYKIRNDGRRMRALCANLWLAYECSWNLARIDPRAPHRDTIYQYLSEPEFVAALEKARPILSRMAHDTLTEIMRQSDSDAVRMKTAQWFLEAHEPETYDPGVRRQMRANQGTWINSLLQASLPDHLTRTVGSLDPAGPVPTLDAPLSDNCPISLLIGQSDPVPFPDEIDAESKPVLEKLDIEEESKPRMPCGNSSGLESPPAQGAEPFADGADAGHPPHTFSQKTKNRKKP